MVWDGGWHFSFIPLFLSLDIHETPAVSGYRWGGMGVENVKKSRAYENRKKVEREGVRERNTTGGEGNASSKRDVQIQE